jgi:hypothetical protein
LVASCEDLPHCRRIGRAGSPQLCPPRGLVCPETRVERPAHCTACREQDRHTAGHAPIRVGHHAPVARHVTTVHPLTVSDAVVQAE